MNFLKSIAFTMIVLSALALNANSAGILLDAFSFNGFSLQSGGSTTQNVSDPKSDFNSRVSRGSGDGNWVASIDSDRGIFNYTGSVSNLSFESQFFTLRYSTRGYALDLLGLNTINLNIVSLTGDGELQVVFLNQPSSTAAYIPIRGLGDVAFPFSDLFPAGRDQFPSDLTIKIVPKSTNFSIDLNEISIVPEANGIVLLAGTATVWGLRRRRAMPTIPLP